MTALPIAVLTALTALTVACGTVPRSPVQRARAVELYAAGASYDEVAIKLDIRRDEARELIRIGIVELTRTR
ncbi:MAG: hypothetical protein WKG01_24310 [Kofleriaceae bacterium]